MNDYINSVQVHEGGERWTEMSLYTIHIVIPTESVQNKGIQDHSFISHWG